jgi:hypothetical protein
MAGGVFFMTREQIIQLHQEFSKIRTYTDKLAFYDKHFNIIPFSFPPFQTDLYAFFSDKNVDLLMKILEIERKTPHNWTREFPFDNETYSFCVKPWNQNHIILKRFIIDKWINEGSRVDLLVKKRLKYVHDKEQACEEMLEMSSQMIKYFRHKIRHEFERSFKTQFIAVFLKGISDCMYMQAIDKKRKFIELYLYAQGILYGRYVETLKRFCRIDNLS